MCDLYLDEYEAMAAYLEGDEPDLPDRPEPREPGDEAGEDDEVDLFDSVPAAIKRWQAKTSSASDTSAKPAT